MAMYKVRCTVKGKVIDEVKSGTGVGNESKVYERIRKVGLVQKISEHHRKWIPFHAIDLVEIEKIPVEEERKINAKEQAEREAKQEVQRKARLATQQRIIEEKVRVAKVKIQAEIATAQGATATQNPVAGGKLAGEHKPGAGKANS